MTTPRPDGRRSARSEPHESLDDFIAQTKGQVRHMLWTVRVLAALTAITTVLMGIMLYIVWDAAS